MGNFIVTTGSVFIPLFTKLVTVPYFYHPHHWGGIPWEEPGGIGLNIVSFIFNVLTLAILATVSGMMTTERECRKYKVWKSMKRSIWAILGYIIGNIVIFMLPVVKAPLLAIFAWLPYAGYLVHGMMVSAFVMLFGALGNQVLRMQVC